MSEDEPDLKRENLADSDDSPFGDTTEHAGEHDDDGGETYHDPDGGTVSASPGEGEGGERVPTPDSERMANRDDV
jgi:hypothetical protein